MKRLTEETKYKMICTIDDYLEGIDFNDDECDHENCYKCSFVKECYITARARKNSDDMLEYSMYCEDDELELD